MSTNSSSRNAARGNRAARRSRPATPLRRAAVVLTVGVLLPSAVHSAEPPPAVAPPPAPRADAPEVLPRVVPPTAPRNDSGFEKAGKASPERQDLTLLMFSKIKGKVTAGKADLNLNGPVTLYDVRVEDKQGRVLLTMERMEFSQSLTQLAMDRKNRGPLHLIRPQAFVVFRDGTCNFVETMGDWWAEESRGKGPEQLKLEIVEGLLHVVDEAKGKQFILSPFNFMCLPEAKQPANRVFKAAVTAPLQNVSFALQFRYDAALQSFDVSELAFRAPEYGYQLALRGSIAPSPQLPNQELFLQLFGAYDYDWGTLSRRLNLAAVAPNVEIAGQGRLPVKLSLPLGKIVALLPKPAPPPEVDPAAPPQAAGWINPGGMLGGLFGGGGKGNGAAKVKAKTEGPVAVAPQAAPVLEPPAVSVGGPTLAPPEVVAPPLAVAPVGGVPDVVAPPPPRGDLGRESNDSPPISVPSDSGSGNRSGKTPPPPAPNDPNAPPAAVGRPTPNLDPAPPAVPGRLPALPNNPPPVPSGFGQGQPPPPSATLPAPIALPPVGAGEVGPPPLPGPPPLAPAEEEVEPLTAGAASSPLAALPALDALQDLVVETSIGWERLRFRGVEMGATEVPLVVQQAGVDVGPMKAILNDGWLTFACRIEQRDGRIVMLLPKGPLLTQIRLTEELCHRVLVMAAPMMARAMKVDGAVSLDLLGGIVPLDAPAAADVTAQLRVHGIHGELNPDLARIASRLGIGPVVSLLDDNVTNLRLVEGRLYHEGMGIVMGDNQLYTRGSVGIDRTIDVMAEVTLSLAFLPNGPLGQRLKGTKLQVPVTGTLDDPKIGKVSSPNFNLGEIGQGDGPLGNLLRNLQDPAGGRPVGQGGILDRLRARRGLRGVPPPVQP